MNHYTELLSYIKQLAEGDNYINTVTKDAPADLDLFKANIFPLFNVDIVSGSIKPQTIMFRVELSCFALRDINKEVLTDKFWKQDNEVDNHNETAATLNRMWKIMYRDFNKNNITTLTDEAPIDKVDSEGKNLHDGWSMVFDVEMPNTELNLCAVSKEWN